MDQNQSQVSIEEINFKIDKILNILSQLPDLIKEILDERGEDSTMTTSDESEESDDCCRSRPKQR